MSIPDADEPVKHLASTRPSRGRTLCRVGLLGLAALASACNRGKSKSATPPPGGQRPLEVDFLLRTDLHLGTAFVGDVLYADLDADGIADLAESNFGTGFLTLAQGRADGGFTVLHELPTRGHPFRLASGDFDGDGLVDVAVADGDWIDGAQQAVEVFLQGPAPFAFGAPIVLDLAVDPKDLVAVPAGGVAGSAGPDELWVALRQDAAIVRLELSSGVLVETARLDSAAIGSGSPFSLAAVDVGGDGLVDLVLGEDNVGADRVVLFPRTGGGFGTPQVILEPLNKPVVDATGDVDGNGYDDLAVAQVESDFAMVLLGDATGLVDGRMLDLGGASSSLLFEDVSGDGLPDVVATLFEQESVQVRLATAPATWGPPEHYNVGLAPRAIGVLDLLGDGVADLLCGNAQDLSVLHGLGAGRFRGARGTPIGPDPAIGVTAADLDNDGDPDAVVLTESQQTLVFLRNDGGVLTPAATVDLVPTLDEDSGYFALSDVTGSGYLDVVATVTESDELRLFRNDGSLDGFRQAPALDVVPVGDGPLGIDLADLDEDGRVDAVVGLLGDRSVEVLRGTDAGPLAGLGAPFESIGTTALGFEPLDVRIADLDEDGHLDVVLSGRDGSGPSAPHLVAVLAGDGAGALTLVDSYPAPAGAARISLADLDEDGALDLVVGHFATIGDELLVLRNAGALAFDASTVVSAPGPGTPILADADRDGHLDLLVLTTEGELDLLTGDGTGRFQRALPRVRGAQATLEGAVGGALADLGGDGLPELLMVGPGSPFVWTARNTSFERVAP